MGHFSLHSTPLFFLLPLALQLEVEVVAGAVAEAVAEAVQEAVQEAVHDAVQQAIEENVQARNLEWLGCIWGARQLPYAGLHLAAKNALPQPVTTAHALAGKHYAHMLPVLTAFSSTMPEESWSLLA